jgi:hypothetical protein
MFIYIPKYGIIMISYMPVFGKTRYTYMELTRERGGGGAKPPEPRFHYIAAM